MKTLTRPTLRASLRLSIVDKLRRVGVTDIHEANARIDEMLEFLDRCGDSDGPSGERPPSQLVDEAWHAFIIHTGDYADYCTTRFGRFIHHRPDPVKGDCDDGGCGNCRHDREADSLQFATAFRVAVA